MTCVMGFIEWMVKISVVSVLHLLETSDGGEWNQTCGLTESVMGGLKLRWDCFKTLL